MQELRRVRSGIQNEKVIAWSASVKGNTFGEAGNVRFNPFVIVRMGCTRCTTFWTLNGNTTTTKMKATYEGSSNHWRRC